MATTVNIEADTTALDSAISKLIEISKQQPDFKLPPANELVEFNSVDRGGRVVVEFTPTEAFNKIISENS